MHWLEQAEGWVPVKIPNGEMLKEMMVLSPEAALFVPGTIPVLCDDSAIAPNFFQAGKLRHGEAKLSNLSKMRLLYISDLGFKALQP